MHCRSRIKSNPKSENTIAPAPAPPPQRKQNNFINIAAMKINVVFEFNSFSAEVKASGHLKILSKNLIENCLDYLERESLICSFCTFGSHQRCKKPLQKDEKRPKQEKY